MGKGFLNVGASTRNAGEFGLDVSRGLITNVGHFYIFGFNPDVGTSVEDIQSNGGLYTWLQSAVTIEAVSTSADDTAEGSGARSIVVHGLDENWDPVDVTLTMNGTSATTASTETLIRLNYAEVVDTGTYASDTVTGTQAGDITIRTSGGGATHLVIPSAAGGFTWKFGRSAAARYSVPRGKMAFLKDAELSNTASKPCDVVLWSRKGGNVITPPYTPKEAFLEFEELEGQRLLSLDTPIEFPEYTDIWVSAAATGAAGAKTDVFIEMLTVDA
jgi:hypothetical protein